GQGPLEKPPLAPMHQPFGRFGGQYLVARRGQQWPELLEVGGVAWSPTMGRALADDPCSLAERLVRLSLQLYPTFRKETAGWERPLRRGPQTPIPQPEPVVLNPEPTWGELAFTVLAGVCVAGGVAAVAAMGTVPAVIAGAAALSYGVYSSYQQRDAEWDLVGYQPTAYERLVALAADMTETSSVYAVWYGEDLVNGQPVGPKARLGMVLNAVLPGFVGTRVTRRIHTRRMIQVADEITPGDLLKITGETTAKYGGTFEGRTLRTVLGLRDPQLQRYVGNLRRRLAGTKDALHVVRRRAAGLEGDYEAGLLTWTLKDAQRYFALDNPRKPGVKGFVQHHLDFYGSDARKVWTAGKKSAREQLRLNANLNRTLKETRRP
ncbi:MAG TPA: hypothetical protein PKY30_24720, partial [Myxococcota bacterium]|nr:hypothetical protein [Myxococcota bacterium]